MSGIGPRFTHSFFIVNHLVIKPIYPPKYRVVSINCQVMKGSNRCHPAPLPSNSRGCPAHHLSTPRCYCVPPESRRCTGRVLWVPIFVESIPLGVALSISLILRAQTHVLICILTSFFSRTYIPICHRNCSRLLLLHLVRSDVSVLSWFFGRILDLYPYHHYDCVIGNYVYGS